MHTMSNTVNEAHEERWVDYELTPLRVEMHLAWGIFSQNEK